MVARLTAARLVVATLLAMTAAVHAGDLPDPTRPPTALQAASAPASAPSGALQLQSVLLGRGRTEIQARTAPCANPRGSSKI